LARAYSGPPPCCSARRSPTRNMQPCGVRDRFGCQSGSAPPNRMNAPVNPVVSDLDAHPDRSTERAGFEPAMEISPHTRLSPAVCCRLLRSVSFAAEIRRFGGRERSVCCALLRFAASIKLPPTRRSASRASVLERTFYRHYRAPTATQWALRCSRMRTSRTSCARPAWPRKELRRSGCLPARPPGGWRPPTQGRSVTSRRPTAMSATPVTRSRADLTPGRRSVSIARAAMRQ